MRRRKLIIVIVLTILVVAGVTGAYSFLNQQEDTGLVACTLEAKICPDGSAVGRTGPNCEFAECPSEQVKRDILTDQESQNPCGPEPPALCQAGAELVCNPEDKKWGCFPLIEESDLPQVRFACAPKFRVESGSELTASEDYSIECLEKDNKESCETVDIYSANSETFGDADGTPDCQWIAL